MAHASGPVAVVRALGPGGDVAGARAPPCPSPPATL